MKIDINYIARVEGESSVKLEIEGGNSKNSSLISGSLRVSSKVFLWEGNLTRFGHSCKDMRYMSCVPYDNGDKSFRKCFRFDAFF